LRLVRQVAHGSDEAAQLETGDMFALLNSALAFESLWAAVNPGNRLVAVPHKIAIERAPDADACEPTVFLAAER